METSEFLKFEAAAAVLKAASAAGTLGNDKEFVESLLKSYAKYASLSPKQEIWFFKLAEKHSGKPAVAAPVAASVGAFEGVYSLFAKAKAKLKFPKINLQLLDGSPIVLYLAGPNSKKPGVINVTNGAKFGALDNKWYGRVNPDGSLESGAAHPEAGEVKALLSTLAAEPVKVAAAHAKLSGRCCFCNLKLTDKKSTAAGFGETCSKNFGLHAEWKASVNLFEALAKNEAAAPVAVVAVDPAVPGSDETVIVPVVPAAVIARNIPVSVPAVSSEDRLF